MLLTARSHALKASFLLLAGGLAILGAPSSQAAKPNVAEIRQEYPQALDMAGYVLGAEMNMNQKYTRQLNRMLLPVGEKIEDRPLIRWEEPAVDNLEHPTLRNTP